MKKLSKMKRISRVKPSSWVTESGRLQIFNPIKGTLSKEVYTSITNGRAKTHFSTKLTSVEKLRKYSGHLIFNGYLD